MKPDKITCHWTGSRYKWRPGKGVVNYHFLIDHDGTTKQILSIHKTGAHTWRRNTANIGISFVAMYDDPKTKHLDYPVTAIQVERMARLIAELVFKLDISWDNVQDHKFYAKKDGYYPLRWDIGGLLPIVKAKAQWYHDRLVKGTDKPELTLHLY